MAGKSCLVKMFVPLLVVLASVSGCGNSSLDPLAGAAETSNPALLGRFSGTWGGYFPGSSLDHPKNGIEIDFDAQDGLGNARAIASIHRENWEVQRHSVLAERSGDTVILSFDRGSPGAGTFTGRFVDEDTLEGIFTQASRRESFPMTLRSARSVPIQSIVPIVPLVPATLSPALSPKAVVDPGPYLTLRLPGLAVFGVR